MNNSPKKNNNQKSQKKRQGPSKIQMNKQSNKIVPTQPPASFGFNLPPSSFEISRGPKPDSVRIKGRDFLGTVTSPSPAPSIATLIRNDFLSPGAGLFDGTRLNRFSSLYEKYVFRKCKFIYVPVLSVNQAGQIGMAFDKDYADTTPPAGDLGFRQYMGFQNAITGPVWNKIELDVKLTDMQDFYYCNDSGFDGRLVYQGQLYLFAASTLVANTTYGTLYIEYDIDFFDPQIENPLDYTTLIASPPTAISGTANAGWNLLTAGVKGVGKIITDTSGNQGIELPPGQYIIEQIFASAGAITSWASPSVIATNVAAVASLVSIALATASTAGFIRTDRLTVTGGPVRLYGNLASAATLTYAGVKILASYGNQSF